MILFCVLGIPSALTLVVIAIAYTRDVFTGGADWEA
jgi:hypothetical protein